MKDRVLRVVVADDEPLARRGLVEFCGEHPSLRCVGVAEDGEEVLELISRERPEMVLLDIEMPGRSGLEVARTLAGDGLPYVVLVTAFERHALEAFDVGVSDYLLKPVEPGRFGAMVARALSRITSGFRPRVVHVPDGRAARVLPVEEIIWIEAQDCYVEIHLEEEALLHRDSLKSMARRLAAAGFVRVHRSALVNVAAIVRVRSSDSGCSLVLTDGSEVPVSRRRRATLRRMLRNGGRSPAFSKGL